MYKHVLHNNTPSVIFTMVHFDTHLHYLHGFFSDYTAEALALIHSTQCRGVLLLNNSKMSACTPSSLLASSSHPTIMLSWLVTLKSHRGDFGHSEVTMRGNCQNPQRNRMIFLPDTDGREKTKSLMNI